MSQLKNDNSLIFSSASIPSSSVFSGDTSKPVKYSYLVIDSQGDGDDTYYNRLPDALMSLLEDKVLGDVLERLMSVQGIKHTDDPFNMERYEWFSEHSSMIKMLAIQEGYRIIEVKK